MRMRLLPVVLAVAALAGCQPVAAHNTTPAGPAGKLSAAVARLPVAAENRAGYQRSRFRLWTDADRDGCDTRAEVLVAEATTRPTVGAGCRLSGGRWISWYDRAVWTQPADLDIDHLVPLAEAWDSGAYDWPAARREAYANDLDDPRTLVAVTDNVNQAKGDQDPAEWLPAFDRCRYVGEWVAVKLRWRLAVDRAEQATLSRWASQCPDVTVKVQRAY